MAAKVACMAQRDETLEAELAETLGGKFRGMEVSVEHSRRWNRMCATFRWKGFAGLLPEERFHRLTTVIPAEFRNTRMKGFVWLELAPGEEVDQVLAMPRSEDVAPREKAIRQRLTKAGFFDALQEALGDSPQEECDGDFARTLSVLKQKKWSSEDITDAKLVFIRGGVYCDCQVK
jgi:hypothetical protein